MAMRDVLDQSDIDAAAVQIANQIRILKQLLVAASLVMLAGLIHMKAWREWPLAFWVNDKAESAVAFSKIVDASITFQAGHFLFILAAIFLPISYRLRTAALHLAVLEHGPVVGSAHETWLGNKGLSLSTKEIIQRAITIASPFLVPAAAESVVLVQRMFA